MSLFSLRIVVGCCGTLLWLGNQGAIAQIQPDQTLPVNSTVPLDCLACTIDGGTIRGQTLFHSFKTFSIPTGGGAWFNNPAEIQTILTRVTGNSRSTIDGWLRANGTASLFLLNPNGIILGPQAQLQLGGSFGASTAASWQLPDGSEFSAVRPQAPPLLAINVPLGLQTGLPIGDLQQQGRLVVAPGQRVELVGRSLVHTGQIMAPGGSVHLLGDRVSLLAPSQIDVSGPSGGRILIGGDFHGQGVLPRATATVVEAGVKLRADGLAADAPTGGDGGQIVVWADGQTAFGGVASARGAASMTSRGGWVEISGKEALTFRGGVDVAGGQPGTVLFDPKNIIIRAGGTDLLGANDAFGENPEATVTFDPAVFNGLNGNVVLQASNDIIIDQEIATAAIASLTLEAGRSILLNQSVLLGPDGRADFTANAGLSRGVVDSQREPGAAVISMASGTVLGAGQGITITMGTGAGQTNATAGDITLTRLFSVSGLSDPPIQVVHQGSGNLALESAVTLGGDVVLQAGGAVVAQAIETAPRGEDTPAFLGLSSGSIQIVAGGNITTGDLITSSAVDTGEIRLISTAGNIDTTAGELVTEADINSGAIRLQAAGNIQTGPLITKSLENSGDVAIAAGGTVVVTNSLISTEADAEGTSGSIQIDGRSVVLSGGTQLSSSANGAAQGGNVSIRATDGVLVTGNAPAGQAPRGFFAEADNPFDRPEGEQLGGFRPPADFEDQFNGIDFPTGIFTDTTGTGRAGNIQIATPRLVVSEGAAISATTFGAGRGGDIGLGLARGVGSVVLNDAAIWAGPTGEAIGDGGNILVQTGTLVLRDGATLSTLSLGQGNGGTIQVLADEGVSLAGTNRGFGEPSSFLSGAEGATSGRGGDITVTTSRLSLADGSELNARTNSGFAGGNITVNAAAFEATGGSRLVTSTSSGGSAGQITLNVAGELALVGRGTGLFASTSPGSSGRGGDILIQTPETIAIANGAGIAVGSLGTGQGGNIAIATGRLALDNRAFLSAETASSQGGNIAITSSGLITLRRNSLISTTAGTAQAGGNGGNITIFAPNSFVVAALKENSDIRANAFTGNGGNIAITAIAIYGLRSQPINTRLSDITASSQFGFSGSITLNTLNVDPSQGVESLPGNLVDPSNQIALGCAPGSEITKRANRFVVTGKGGLPLQPEEGQPGQALVELTPLVQPGGQSRSRAGQPAVVALLEARQWRLGTDGSVYLIAQPAAPQSPRGWEPSVPCPK